MIFCPLPVTDLEEAFARIELIRAFAEKIRNHLFILVKENLPLRKIFIYLNLLGTPPLGGSQKIRFRLIKKKKKKLFVVVGGR